MSEDKQIKSANALENMRSSFPQWQPPGMLIPDSEQMVDRWKMDVEHRLRCLEDTMARIEDTVNRMSIALGCDNKSRVLVVKDYVGVPTHEG